MAILPKAEGASPLVLNTGTALEVSACVAAQPSKLRTYRKQSTSLTSFDAITDDDF